MVWYEHASHLQVYTGNLNTLRGDPDLVDITVKSGWKAFAPTWHLVMSYKNGRISEDDYTKEYLQMMRISYRQNPAIWEKLLGKERVVLGCYCPTGTSFCHRYILAEVLERLGAEVKGELLSKDGVVQPIPRLASSFLVPRADIVGEPGGLLLDTPAVAFTGHRPEGLGGYSDSDPVNQAVRRELAARIRSYLEKGWFWFISGGALGTDQIAAEEVIRLGGRLLVARPFPSQDKNWPRPARERYWKILRQADHVVTLAEDPYTPEKMLARSRWMVDHAQAIVAVYRGIPGGTRYCIEYARSRRKPVDIINPAKLDVRV